MKNFLMALQFLTTLPISGMGKPGEKDFGQSLRWFPVAGAVIGGLLVVAANILSPFPDSVRVSLLIVLSIIITGGMHLDGLADTCDGIFSGKKKEDILSIMRDPRIGTMGVLGLISVILIKYTVLCNLPGAVFLKSLFAVPVFSRFVQVFCIYRYDYARQDGKGKLFFEHKNKDTFIIGAVFTALIFLGVFGFYGAVIFLGALGIIFFTANNIKNKIGGMTGDTIGALSELAEIIMLIFISLKGYIL